MSSDDATDLTDGDDQSRREKAVEGFDAGIVDLLSWVLDTETRAKIYIYLQANPGSTSEEIAQGTGLYPSTVREALAELHDEDTVEREKRESEGAGNNPYEYTAIAPSDLVSGVVGQVQDELNTVFNLDSVLQRGDEDDLVDDEPEDEPVTITVSSETSTSDGDADDDDSNADDDDDDSNADDDDDDSNADVDGEDGDLKDATADDE